MQGVASEVQKNSEKQQMLENQKQETLYKADQDVKSMSEFLDKSKERKIRLQKERQDVQKAIAAQTNIKEAKKKQLSDLNKKKESQLESLLRQHKTEESKVGRQIGVTGETMQSIREFRDKSVD